MNLRSFVALRAVAPRGGAGTNAHPLSHLPRLSRAGIQFASLALGGLCAIAAVRGADATPAATREWNIRDHIPLEHVVLQAHRGAGFLAEENTIAAFELGWKLGCYPEADIRTTSDGVIVTFHDANFDRVVKNPPPELKGKGVQHVTWARLQQLDVGAWKGEQFEGRRVSKLSDAFAVMRGQPARHLYLDIKQVDFPQLAAEVKAAQVGRQIVFASPKPEQIAEWKQLVPDSDALLWMRGSEAQLRARLVDLRKSNFAGITQLQIHIFPQATIEEALKLATITADKIDVKPAEAKASRQRFTLSDAFIVELGNELRARGILFQALPYTSDPSVYAQLLDLGLMSFATDYPDVTVRELKAYYANKK